MWHCDKPEAKSILMIFLTAAVDAQLLSSQIHHEIRYYIWQEWAHEQPTAQLKGQNKHWPS